MCSIPSSGICMHRFYAVQENIKSKVLIVIKSQRLHLQLVRVCRFIVEPETHCWFAYIYFTINWIKTSYALAANATATTNPSLYCNNNNINSNSSNRSTKQYMDEKTISWFLAAAIVLIRLATKAIVWTRTRRFKWWIPYKNNSSAHTQHASKATQKQTIHGIVHKVIVNRVQKLILLAERLGIQLRERERARKRKRAKSKGR